MWDLATGRSRILFLIFMNAMRRKSPRAGGFQSVAGAMPANGPKGKGVVRYACDVAGPGDTTTNSMPYSWPTTGICG
jgi:hypothetical protein